MLPVPGFTEKAPPPEVREPIIFTGTMIADNALTHHGQVAECFLSAECPDEPEAGDRVQAAFVQETQQVYIIAKIA
jgi:hypothetical protein